MIKKIAVVGSILGFAFLCSISIYLVCFVSPSLSYDIKVVWKYVSNYGSDAFPGKNGWFFYRGALRSLITPWPNENIDNIGQLNKLLLQDSIQLLVVPVPNKNEVYPDSAELGNPQVVSNQRNRLIQRLHNANIHVIDLLPVFKSANQNKLFYFKHDSHWNMNGISVAVKEISNEIHRMEPTISHSRFLKTIDTESTCYNDLWKLFYNDHSNGCEGLCSWKKVILLDGRPYKGDPLAPVLIFGDSFVNAGSDVNANLFAQIAYATGISTRNYFTFMAFEEGARKLKAYLNNTKSKPKIIVWVFVSCKLSRRFPAP